MEQAEIKQVAVRLVELRSQLLAKYPFFGRLLMRLPFGFSDCETAYTDMRQIVFDPSFAHKLNDEQLSFVILHELMHCVLKHCTRGRGKLHRLYNIACDIVVNSIILEALGIAELKIDEHSVMHLAPNNKEGREYSAEEVYDMLLKDVDRDFQKIYGFSLFDNHDIWDSISNDPLIEDIWDKYTKDAARGVGKGSGIPDSIVRKVAIIERKEKISWKQVLHDYIQFDQSDYVFSPPDKRYSGDIILPSFQEAVYGSKLNNIWYVVDTSGSINSRVIAEAFNEIKNAIEQINNVEGFISFFDCEITEPLPFSKIEEIDDLKPVGGGGTNFNVIFKYLSDKMTENLPRVIVIITDGYATFPNADDALDVPVIWLIVDSDVEPPFGEILHIYTES